MGWWEDLSQWGANVVTGGQYGKATQALQQNWGKPAPPPVTGSQIKMPSADQVQQGMIQYGTGTGANVASGRGVLPMGNSAPNQTAAGLAAGSLAAAGAAGAAAPYAPGLASQAGQAIASNPMGALNTGLGLAGGAASLAGGLGGSGNPSGYDAERLALDRERHNAAMASIGRIQGIANPYDPNSEAWKKSLAQALNTQTRNFAGSEARIQGDLAGRGMLGSGYESAALGGLGARRAQALSDTENQMYADALRGAASFDLGREQAILSGLGAQNNLGATLADLARTQREQDSAFWNGAGNLGATILQNWDKLAGLAQQFGLGSPQAVEQAVKSGTAPAALMDVIQGGVA